MMIPIVAVVSEDVHERLQPIVDEVVARFDEQTQANSSLARTLRLNGWTSEMIAWGRVLAAASEVELEVVPS